MTFYLTLRYPTGHHQTLTFPSAFSRALIVITAAPYADVIRQWETDEAFQPRVVGIPSDRSLGSTASSHGVISE